MGYCSKRLLPIYHLRNDDERHYKKNGNVLTTIYGSGEITKKNVWTKWNYGTALTGYNHLGKINDNNILINICIIRTD